jgi:hypothetical protein
MVRHGNTSMNHVYDDGFYEFIRVIIFVTPGNKVASLIVFYDA